MSIGLFVVCDLNDWLCDDRLLIVPMLIVWYWLSIVDWLFCWLSGHLVDLEICSWLLNVFGLSVGWLF